jgi:hypothetical protein
MATPEQIRELLSRLEKVYRDLGKENPFKNWNASAVGDAAAQAEILTTNLNAANRELNELNSDINETVVAFHKMVDEIKSTNSGLNLATKTMTGMSDIGRKLKYDQEGINELSGKELKSLQQQYEQKRNDLKISKDILGSTIQELIQKQRGQGLDKEEEKQLTKSKLAHRAIVNELQGEDRLSSVIEGRLNQRIKQEERLNELMGVGGAAVAGTKAALDKMGLGGLSNALGLDKVNEKMAEMAKKLEADGKATDKFANKFEVVKAGVKEAGNQLKTSLQDPTIVATFLVKQFVDALQSVDNLAGDTAKKFNLSYQEASKLNSQLNDTANLSGDAAVNTKGLQESMVAVGKTLGSNAKLNDKDLVTFTKLREQAGYTNEELASIQTLSLVNGKTLEDNTKEILGSAQAYASQNKLIVNEKEVLREVGKASASLKLSLGGSTSALAEAVVKAKQFGLTLEQSSRIASGLLNFEDSISNEIEAELLTGKDLNLEQARLLALNGKTAEAAAEVAKQVGSSAQFGKMNVIQQEAIAKSVGMSRDELAQSLIDKEALNKLSGVEGKDAKEKFDNLVKQVGMEKAKKQLGNDQLANQYNQQSAQEKLANITSKLQELFISIAEPVMAIVSPFVELATKILPLVNIALFPIINGVKVVGEGISFIFNSIKGVYDMFMGTNKQLSTMEKIIGSIGIAYLTYQGIVVATNVVQGISAAISERKALAEGASLIAVGAQKVAEAAGIGIKAASAVLSGTKMLAEVTAAEAVSFGLVTFAIIGGLAAVYAAMSSKKVGDVMSPANGKTQISTKEGELLELSGNDDLVAAPGLLDKKSKSSASSSPSPQIDLSPLVERINVLIDAVKAGGNVYLDATKVGTAMNVGTYKVQ